MTNKHEARCDVDGLVNTLNKVLQELGSSYVTRVLDMYVVTTETTAVHPAFCCRRHEGMWEIGALGLLGYIAGTSDGVHSAVCAVLDESGEIVRFRRTDGEHVLHPYRLSLDPQLLLSMWCELYQTDPNAYDALQSSLDVHTFFFSLISTDRVTCEFHKLTDRSLYDVRQHIQQRAMAVHSYVCVQRNSVEPRHTPYTFEGES